MDKEHGDPPATATDRRPASVTGGLFRALVHWAPVWIPLVLLAQIGLLGLRPALREARLLRQSEAVLETRRNGALDRQTYWKRMLDAQHDPMFIERERRRALDPQHARARN